MTEKVKVITKKLIKGDLEFDGKIVFERELGLVEVKGNIKAGGDIEVRYGTELHCSGGIVSGGRIWSDENIRAGGYISSGRYIWSGGDIISGRFVDSNGNIWSGGSIKVNENIISAGSIRSNGDINSGAYIYFSFFLKFRDCITCKLLRISPKTVFERDYWIERLNLFGFEDIAEIIKEGCTSKIRTKLSKIKGIEKRLLECPHWTQTERLVILSWLKGGLENYSLEERKK